MKQQYVVVEKTAKAFKFVSLLCGLAMLFGVVSCASGESTGGVLFFGAFGVYVLNRIVAWWFHG